MSTIVFVNFPVKDVAKSTTFYQKLGFTLNSEFSTNEASALVWDEHFMIMLLDHGFYRKFIGDKAIADTKTTSGALIAFSLESVDAVKAFGEKAEANGGKVFHIDMGFSEDQMFNLEVQDLDGNILEPNWMKM